MWIEGRGRGWRMMSGQFPKFVVNLKRVVNLKKVL
jgi:hypothetical protein